jgi:N-acetylglucosaminyldiphosphoundecaprenol N-acetyl-beta-D-mannosaminyltransferase
MERIALFGMPFIAAPDHGAVLDEICAWPTAPRSVEELPLVSTPNVDQVVKLHRPANRELFERLRHARFILPDGQPIVAVSKMTRDRRLPARLAGSDLFPPLWKRICERSAPVFMVLGSEAVATRLRQELPAMRHVVPPFYSIEDAGAESRLIEAVHTELTAHPVDLVFLGLGFPKQERLALALIDRFRSENRPLPLFLLLGASFEFHAGLKKRAPKVYQRLGLEFLHRFLSEPRRMFRRYFVDDLAFLPLAIREVLAR